ncbi:hypothetical protein CV102_23045 [Natronococcus pandeyae]|uniref:Uncharacterized protein n=1 Tax=Natronococcus pandeyae TaxID=2055836 RepID=A0A8J8TNI1_9EURY|nr:hypothetical protein CV102_23045 [Natronococcus pandeyae]
MMDRIYVVEFDPRDLEIRARSGRDSALITLHIASSQYRPTRTAGHGAASDTAVNEHDLRRNQHGRYESG